MQVQASGKRQERLSLIIDTRTIKNFLSEEEITEIEDMHTKGITTKRAIVMWTTVPVGIVDGR